MSEEHDDKLLLPCVGRVFGEHKVDDLLRNKDFIRGKVVDFAGTAAPAWKLGEERRLKAAMELRRVVDGDAAVHRKLRIKPPVVAERTAKEVVAEGLAIDIVDVIGEVDAEDVLKHLRRAAC